MKICKVEGCNNSAMYKDDGHKGYCAKHYSQLRQYGKILERTKYDPNEIINCEDYCEICLYKHNPHAIEIARAKIDREDLEKVKKYKWCLSKGYVTTIINKKNIKLHQLVIGKKDEFEIDHQNINPLDNRKQNLRFATRSQNAMNQENVKGYYWDKKRKKWQVQIRINQRNIYLGCFISKQDAIIARKQAEQKYFGEFAYQNN